MTYANPRMRGVLTTEHSLSSYRVPVLIVDGRPYGPCDYLPSTDADPPEDLIAEVFGGPRRARRIEIVAAWHILQAHPGPHATTAALPLLARIFVDAWHAAGAPDSEREASR